MTTQRQLQLLRAEQLRHEQFAKLDTARAAEHLEVAEALQIARAVLAEGDINEDWQTG